MANGKGELNGTVCAVTACNGGYDNGDKLGLCLETLMGYFSPPDSKERNKCPETAPDNAILVTTDTWGISLKHECWTCKEGFIKDTNGDCVFPEKGKYIDPEGTRKECSPVENGTFVKNTAAVTLPTGCDFTCNDGYRENTDDRTCDEIVGTQPKRPLACPTANGEGRKFWSGNRNAYEACKVVSCNPGYYDKAGTCTKTENGYYSFSAPARSIAQRAKRSGKKRLECLKPANSIPVTAVGLSDPHSCYKCKPGYVKRMRGKGACVLPHRKLYVNTSGEIAKCTRPKSEGFANFIKNASGKVGTPDACDFRCKQGFKKNAEFRTCDKQDVVAKLPKTRKLHKSCSVPNAKKGRMTWAVSKYGTCEVIACKPGYVKKNNTCALPDQGKYSDGDVELSCHVVGGQGGTFLANTGAVSTNKGCSFSCATGLSKDESGYACNPPEPGKYVDSTGTPKNCTPITIANGASATWLKGAAGSAVTCPFSCNAGFVKKNRKCSFPDSGKYVDIRGNQHNCRPIGTGFGAWIQGATSADNGCLFTCSNGFLVDSNTKRCVAATASCSITNGSGTKTWNAGNNAYGTCTLVSCNAGFDNTPDAIACEQTAANFYSVANDKTRTACPTRPPVNSSKVTATGLADLHGCYTCNAGYWKSTQGNGSCNLPDKGKWVNANDNTKDNDCSTVTGGNFDDWVVGAAAAANECSFSCANGYAVNSNTRTCVAETQVCNVLNGTGKQVWDITNNTYGTCSLTACDAGFDSTQDAAKCQATESGYFSLANENTKTACSTPANAAAVTTTRRSSRHGCYTCNAGYWKSTQGNGSCNLPDKGKWVNANDNTKDNDCSTVTGGNFDDWVVGAAAAANECSFSCANGYAVNSNTRTCVAETQACNVLNGTGKQVWDITNNTYGTCSVTACDAGFDSTRDAAKCQATESGYFSLANENTKTACSTPAKSAAVTTTGLSSHNACYTCNAGYWQNINGNGSCNLPDKGKWVNANDNSKNNQCSAITDANFGDWIVGPADAADKCPFSCTGVYSPDAQTRSCVATTASCSPTNGRGTKTWDTGINAYGTCSVISCSNGYWQNTNANSCDLPDAGKWVDSNDNSKNNDCDVIRVPGGVTATFTQGATAAANTCPFSCSNGYSPNTDTQGRSCVITVASCSITKGSGTKTWDAGRNAYGACTVTSCSSGYWKNTPDNSCDDPPKGFWVNSQDNSNNNACDGMSSVPNFDDFAVGPAGAANACPFSCNNNMVADLQNRTCGVSCIPTGGNGEGQEQVDNSCKITACDTGYDSSQDPTQCQVTASGYFSLTNDKARTACTTPANAVAVTTTGLSSAHACYTCGSGYWKDTTGNGTCSLPDKGKWVKASDNTKINACSAITGGNFADWVVGAAAAANECLFSCTNGYTVNSNTRQCVADTNSCNVANGTGEQSWDTVGNVYSSTCAVIACNAGFDNTRDATACEQTEVNFYSIANDKMRTACPTVLPANSSKVTATGLANLHACYTCKAGYWKSTQGNGSCNLPDKGKWVNTNDNTKNNACTDMSSVSNFDDFVVGPADAANKCPFSCTGVYSPDTSLRSCVTTTASCSPTNGSGTKTWDTGTNAYGVCTVTSCSDGYWMNTNANSCDLPDVGKWVDSNDNSKNNDCNPITVPQGVTATWVSGATAAANTCPFFCSASYSPNSQSRSCVAATTSCSITKGSGVQAWDTATNQYGSTCTVSSCSSGYWKNTQDDSCDVPALGKYVDGNNTQKSCRTPYPLLAIGTWLSGPAAHDQDCPYSCRDSSNSKSRVPGKNTNNRTICVDLKQDCSNQILKGDGEKTWDQGDNAYGTCTLTSCDVGYWKNTPNNTCDTPLEGFWVNSQNNSKSNACTPITDSNFAAWVVGPTDAADKCLFSCSSSLMPNIQTGTCDTLGIGLYLNLQGTISPCTPIGGDDGGFASFDSNGGNSPMGCSFSCNSGYVKVDSTNRECNYPAQSKYVDASNNEQNCTDIIGIHAFNSWEGGPADNEDGCPFSCNSGYRPELGARFCNRATAPKVLVLGYNDGHVLLESGKIQRWGRGSATPIAVDLGSTNGEPNLARAVSKKDNNLCVILKNGSNNHGPLMCGTSGLTKKDLGTDGDGNPYTAKAVDQRTLHGCAILNDDTVKCWGSNNWGEIGGEATDSEKDDWDWVKRGTEGRPLGTTTTAIGISIAGEFSQAYSCAILTNKSVRCWGFNDYSQADPPSWLRASRIASGDEHSCAIKTDGGVRCWGDDNDLTTPPSFGSGNTAVQISTHAYSFFTCVLLSNHTVKCWGDNNKNQLGGGTPANGLITIGTRGDPLSGAGATRIGVGELHACAALESDNAVKCWGSNANKRAADGNKLYFFVDSFPMELGSDGSGVDAGETATLSVNSTPTATALESDSNGKVCKLTVSGGGLSDPWVIEEYSTPETYDGDGTLTTAIDNLITAIGSTVKLPGAVVTLSKNTGGDKIKADVDNAILNGMTLNIYHDNDSGDCTTSPVSTTIALSGGSGAVRGQGIWVVTEDSTGSDDIMLNLDSVEIELGTTGLSKDQIADKVVAEVNGSNWAGSRYKRLPYTAAKLDGDTDAGDDCPAGKFCVVFTQLFKGTAGNESFPFADSAYSH